MRQTKHSELFAREFNNKFCASTYIVMQKQPHVTKMVRYNRTDCLSYL